MQYPLITKGNEYGYNLKDDNLDFAMQIRLQRL